MAIYLSDYLSPSAGSVTGAGGVDTQYQTNMLFMHSNEM